MNRREFIKSVLFGGLALGTGIPLFRSRDAWAEPFPDYQHRVLINLTLNGGPDLRHLFAPEFVNDPASFGYQFWHARSTAYRVDAKPEALDAQWKQYLRTESNGVVFGIHPKAAWLKSYFDEGKVAIVCNVLHSTNRDHRHSLLVFESGDYGTDENNRNRDGWGGRLAKVVSGNVISMTANQRLFCNGPHASNPRDHDNSMVISAANTREFALFEDPKLVDDPGYTGTNAVLSRGLRSYYAAKRDEVGATSAYYRFFQHEKVLRELGDAVSARLAAIPEPESLKRFYGSGDGRLNNTGFGKQLRNLYDSFALSDLLGFRVASLEMGGWDTHKHQAKVVEPKYDDMFGTDKGFATLFAELQKSMPLHYENAVLTIGGEFGRQLSSNGDEGTDHGRGNALIVLGEKVKGGVYGEIFPATEIPKFGSPNTDIEGRTSLEHVFGAVCDWVQPGSGDLVFPNRSAAILEAGLDLSGLLTSS